MALSEGDLVVYPGEVHALMGQNGAGKSTLIKCLTGVYSPDEGEVLFDGKEVKFDSPYDAQQGGISPIYQEINLVPQRTITENVFLGNEIKRGPFLDRRSMTKRAKELLESVGLYIDPELELGTVSTATQQMVAIARALSFDAKLIIMDEPTSSLHDKEVDTLFQVISKLRSSGISVIFISHKLDELYRICDRITILRDGRTIHTGELSELSRIELVATMLGREPESIETSGQTAFKRADTPPISVRKLLDIRNVSSGTLCKNATLSLRAGEVVGIAGLLGAGRSELANAIYGAAETEQGTLKVLDQDGPPRSAKEALALGISLTPEDRKTDGLVGLMSVRENLTLPILKKLSRFGVIDREKERLLVADYMRKLNIKSAGQHQQVSELSGGNQQKVLLARSLVSEPKVLILDEPTRGVDVGAKQEIQSLISKLVSEGDDRGVVLISSEMEEIIEGSNRIMVMRDGESVAYLDSAAVTNGQLMIYMASGSAAPGSPTKSPEGSND